MNNKELFGHQEVETVEKTSYHKKHEDLSASIEAEKIKNYILQKKLSMYFRRKNIENATKDIEFSPHDLLNYHAKLDDYGELITLDQQERSKTSNEVTLQKEECAQKRTKLEVLLKYMQDRVAAVGYGLIHGKQVDKFLTRQSSLIKDMSRMRLQLIKLRQKMQEKQNTIEELDEVAPGLHLAQYEQLNESNRRYIDKIEEQDEDLCKLRSRFCTAKQSLMHMRQKALALVDNVHDLCEAVHHIDETCSIDKKNFTKIKKQKEQYQRINTKLREESGLLTEPELLIDMAAGMEHVDKLQSELDSLKRDFNKRSSQIVNIRERIEMRKGDKQSNVKNEPPKVCKGRPNLKFSLTRAKQLSKDRYMS